MIAAEKIPPMVTEPLSWAEICIRHPAEWVCLVEVEHEPDGPVRSARVWPTSSHTVPTTGCRTAGTGASNLVTVPITR